VRILKLLMSNTSCRTVDDSVCKYQQAAESSKLKSRLGGTLRRTEVKAALPPTQNSVGWTAMSHPSLLSRSIPELCGDDPCTILPYAVDVDLVVMHTSGDVFGVGFLGSIRPPGPERVLSP
jgi:hypothetical protein